MNQSPLVDEEDVDRLAGRGLEGPQRVTQQQRTQWGQPRTPSTPGGGGGGGAPSSGPRNLGVTWADDQGRDGGVENRTLPHTPGVHSPVYETRPGSAPSSRSIRTRRFDTPEFNTPSSVDFDLQPSDARRTRGSGSEHNIAAQRVHAYGSQLLSGQSQPSSSTRNGAKEAVLSRLRSYLPRAVVGGAALHIALGFEVDLDHSYWQHYSTRHDPNMYNDLRRAIEQACHREFNGRTLFPSGGAPPHTMAFYDRTPPSRLGAFEVVLSFSDPAGGIQHVLLHTKLGSAKFPSVAGIVQHVHNLLGSKRAVYHPQHAQDAQGSTAAEPEIVAEFGLSANKPNPRTNGSAHRSNSNNSSNSRGISSRQSSRQAPQSTGAPFVSVGFQTLPGFASSSSSSSSGSVNQGPTAAAASSSSPSLFSGGGAPLKGIQNARPPCELCGGTDYRSRAPVTDRYNHAPEGGKEHGFRSSYAHRARAANHKDGRSRWATRWVGVDCCLSRCATCGWMYLDDANHHGACLPWDASHWRNPVDGGNGGILDNNSSSSSIMHGVGHSMNPGGGGSESNSDARGFPSMAHWGGTKFGCQALPAGVYQAHVPLDSRQRRRVYVDVIDLSAPNANCFAKQRRNKRLLMPEGYDHNTNDDNDSWWEGDDGDDDRSSCSSSGWGNEMQEHGGSSVELVSETTGEVIPLRLMTPSRGGFDDDDDAGRGYDGRGSSPNNNGGLLALNASREQGDSPPNVKGLLCGDVRVPDIYTLRVGGNGTTRYRQANWIEPFELTYLGPMLMTVEVTFDSAIEVVVVDLAGNPLPHATATVRILPNNSSSGGKGQMYALGAAPRRCSLTVPCEIEVVAQCFGHAQVTRLLATDGPLALNHSSWPSSSRSSSGSSSSFDAITAAAARSLVQPGGQEDDDEAQSLAAALTAAVSVGGGSGARLARAQQVLNRAAAGGSSGGAAKTARVPPSFFTGGVPPLTIVVRMRRFDVLFECVDIMGRPLSADDVIGPGPGWRLAFSEHTADATLKPNVYEIPNVLDPRPEQRTVTIGSAERDAHHGPRRGMISISSSEKKSWSVELARGRYFVSHLVIGSYSSSPSASPPSSNSRRAHPQNFTLFESDWEANLQQQDQQGDAVFDERSEKLPSSLKRDSTRQNSSTSHEEPLAQQPPLVVRLVCHCYDVQVRLVDRSQGYSSSGQPSLLHPPPRASVALVSVLMTEDDDSHDEGEEHHHLHAASFLNAQRLDLAIAPVSSSEKKKTAAITAGASPGAPFFEPTCFTAEELKAMSGRYRVVVSVPGFECVNLRVGNRPIAVVSPSGEVLRGVSGNGDHQSSTNSEDGHIGASGCIELSPNLWPSSLETAALPSEHSLHSNQSLTALVVEAELEFKPIPVFAPMQVMERPRLPPGASKDSIDVCLVCDTTASMGVHVKAEALALHAASQELKRAYAGCNLRFAVVCYRDFDPESETPASEQRTVFTMPFANDASKAVKWLSGIPIQGDGDVPDDLLGGLHEALDLDWQATHRLCCVITDAPCHGNRFHSPDLEDVFPSEPDPRGHTAEALLERARGLNLKLVFARLGTATDVMVGEFQAIAETLAAGGAEKRAAAATDKQMEGEAAALVGSSTLEKLVSSTTKGAMTSSSTLKKSIDEVALPPVADYEADPSQGGSDAKKLDENNNNSETDRAGDELDLTVFARAEGGIEGERRAYLRDVIRESLIVGSVHLEVLAAVKLTWRMPVHPIHGALPVASYELQRRTCLLPGAPLSAKAARQTRQRRVESTAGKSKLSSAIPDDEEGWHTAFVPSTSDNMGEHSLVLPAAIPVEFRVRAHCHDGTITSFSDSMKVHVGVTSATEEMGHDLIAAGGQKERENLFAISASRSGINMAPPPPNIVVKVVVRASTHIESVAFIFSDGTRQVFASLAVESKHKQAIDNQAAIPKGKSATQNRINSGAAATSAKASPNKEGAHGGVLLLGQHEHVVEVRGLLSESFTEAIEFVTSHGRRQRFSTPAAGDRIVDVLAGLSAPSGQTRGFRFSAPAGRCVVGLELKPTGFAEDVRQADGFLVTGALYADVAGLTEEEQGAALAAVKAQSVAQKAATTYRIASEQNDANGHHHHQGSSGGDDEYEYVDKSVIDLERQRAAAARRKAELEATKANDAFEDALRSRVADAEAAQQQAFLRGGGTASGSGDGQGGGASTKHPTKTGPTGLASTPTARGAQPFAVEAEFANNRRDRIAVSWVDYRGKEVIYCHLEFAQSKRLKTFAGHCWVARVVGTGELAFTVRVARENSPVYWIGGARNAH